MPLETGDHITDLDPNNPVTATDPVSEGAAHVRLVKRTVQQSFPAIDAPVTKTPDELNDVATQSGNNVMSGNNTHSGDNVHSGITLYGGPCNFSVPPSTENNVAYAGLDTNGLPVSLAAVDASDMVRLGDPANPMAIEAAIEIAMTIDGVPVASVVGAQDGSMEIADSGGVLGRVAAAHIANVFEELQALEQGAVLANNEAILGRIVAGAALALLRMGNDDVAIFGNGASDARLDFFDECRLLRQGVEVARAVDIDDGSFAVRDLAGGFRKAGYRDPRLIVIGADNYTFLQTGEGCVHRNNIAHSTYNLVPLEGSTTFRYINGGAGDVRLTQAGTTITAYLGGATIAGNLRIAPGSVVEIYYESPTVISVFGNGISAF